MDNLSGKRELTLAWRAGGGLVATAFAFSFATNCLLLASPLFVLLIYDRILPSRSEETLWALFFLVAVLFGVTGLVDYSRRRIFARVGAQFQERLDALTFDATARSGIRNLSSNGLRELDNIRGFMHSSSLVAIADFIWAPIFLVIMFLFDPLLSLVCVAGIVCLFVVAMLRAATTADIAERAVVASQRVARMSERLRLSHETLASQLMLGQVKERWLIERRNSRDSSIGLADRQRAFFTLATHLRMFLQTSVLAVGAFLVLKDDLSVGGMIASVILSSRVLYPVEQFFNQIPAIRRVRKNWSKLAGILQDEKQRPRVSSPNLAETRLSAHSVSLENPFDGTNVLHNLSLSLGPGEVLEIIGDSATGKTALARILLGLISPSSGTVSLGGFNIQRLHPELVGRVIGHVPEVATFVTGTILENIARMASSPNLGKATVAAQRAKIHEMIEAFADGYQTLLDPGATLLSQGQRQQLALARALYENPQILLLDEPCPIFWQVYSTDLATAAEAFTSEGRSIIVLGRQSCAITGRVRRLRLEHGALKEIDPGTGAPKISNMVDLDTAKIVRI